MGAQAGQAFSHFPPHPIPLVLDLALEPLGARVELYYEIYRAILWGRQVMLASPQAWPLEELSKQ